MDPLTFTETEARFRYLLESMLCEANDHVNDCSCHELKNLYGRSLYKCGRPGCLSYWVGFDTSSKRDEHIRKHTRPFKCQEPDCPYADFGFATEYGLSLHATQVHEQFLAPVTTGCTQVSNKEVMKDILIDAVKEEDISTLLERIAEVKTFTLSLLLVAYQERSSEAMIKHLLETFPLFSFWNVASKGLQPMMLLITRIFEASIDYGNHDVFFGPHGLFTFWRYHTRDWSRPERLSLYRSIGKSRCLDLIEAVSFELSHNSYSDARFELTTVCLSLIPPRPDSQAELLALECLGQIKTHTGFKNMSQDLFKELGRGCCSINIAEFLLENGADINGEGATGDWPILFAARQNNLASAKFIEFLVRQGAHTSITWRRRELSDFPGPKNIQEWIDITWEELVEQSRRSD